MINFERKPNSVIIVAGPTASGKSGLALDLAIKYGGEIVNADSMQVYQGTPIISAVPTKEEQQKIPHHLYEIYDPSVNGTVVDWLERAVAKIREIWARGKLPIVVGGTGLYIDNLINGTTPIPEPSAEVREKVRQMGDLYAWLQENDAQAAQMLNANDSTRVRRAVEILLQTEKSVVEWYQEPMLKKLPEADFFVIKIIPTAAELDERCYRRFDLMMGAGALEEVKNLATLGLPRNFPAMKMLGVPELLDYLEHKSSLSEAVNLAKLHTRQYAKRQRTWFRNKLNADVTLELCYIR